MTRTHPLPSLTLWQDLMRLPLIFFFFLPHVRSVFLGQDQKELGLKRLTPYSKTHFIVGSLHSQLHSLQPESRPPQTSPSSLSLHYFFWQAAPFIQRINCQRRQCQEVLNELLGLVDVLEMDQTPFFNYRAISGSSWVKATKKILFSLTQTRLFDSDCMH